MKKKLKGFTLVELIVILAIIAVLSAALIPSMNFFIRRAKIKTANSQAKIVFNAALTYSQECEAKNLTVLNIQNGNPGASGLPSQVDISNIELKNGVYTSTDRIARNMCARVNDKVMEAPESDGDVWAVRYENKGGAFPVLTGAIYSTAVSDRYVGCYPTETDYDLNSYKDLNNVAISDWLQYAVDGTVGW